MGNNDLWFKKKKYGTPANRYGWLATGIYLVSALAYPVYCKSYRGQLSWAAFFTILFFTTAIFFGFVYAKGEGPKWQRGDRDQRLPN